MVYDKLKICRSCMAGFPLSELSHNLNLKMIIETEKVLVRLGLKPKWLYHGDDYMYDKSILYESH